LRSIATAGLLVVAACVGAPAVDRAYEDRSVEGRYIGEEAYAAFLQGALAERDGDLRGALASYERAVKSDSRASEVWTRIGALRCALDRGDPAADRAFERALALDPGLGQASTAKAACTRSRGDAAREATRGAAVAPAAADATAAFQGSPDLAAERTALVAGTLTSSDKVQAWETLVGWAAAHGDVALWTEGLERLAHLAPSRRGEIGKAAEVLAAASHVAEARAVAAAAVDASTEPLADERSAFVVRLALDEALARGDEATTRARASRGRVPLEEAAARGQLLGQTTLARRIAGDVVRAEPANLGARLVLAASEGGDVLGACRLVTEGPSVQVSGAAFVAFGETLVHAVSVVEARRTLTHLAHARLVDGDERVSSGATALVSRGALDIGSP
jgi:hypothetical protein